MEKKHKEVVQALRLLNPESQSAVSGLEIIWGDETPIDEASIDSKILEIREDYDAQKYARNRVLAFPSIGDQLDMQYWDQVNSTTTWKDAVAKVKSDNPKPE